MDTQEYKVRDPEGNTRVIRGPVGASDEEVIAQAQQLFSSTPGGAATGNPLLQRQGIKGARTSVDSSGEAIAKIGGATALGGVAGVLAPEILTGLGAGASVFPLTAPLGPPLMFMGRALRGQRIASGVSGAVSGAASETAGQVAENLGAGPVVAESTRLVAGGLTPEVLTGARYVLEKRVLAPSLTALSAIKKEIAKKILGKIDTDPNSLTDKEAAWLKKLVEGDSGIRGGSRSEAELQTIGDELGNVADRGTVQAERMLEAARQEQAGIGRPHGFPEVSSAGIGESLRSTINTKHQAALTQRSDQYKATEKIRDAFVAQREASGQYINSIPEYQEVVDLLKSQLDNKELVQRSPDVQRSIQKVLSELTGGAEQNVEQKLVLQGQNLDLQDVASPKPVSFQAIDDVRRKLGEVFKGKPAEGYEALNDARGKILYAKLTDLQKKFAGGEGGPHAKLLDDYHAQSEALGQFRTKFGRKATALDQYQEGEFATDPSLLPRSYFKTKESVQKLKDLTGDMGLVNKSAAQFAENETQGLNATQLRKWLSRNDEWLNEVPAVRGLMSRHADKIERSERLSASAEIFAKEASRSGDLLKGNRFPVERVVNLIENGTPDLWALAGPAITANPKTKAGMIEAVRQTIADKVKPSNARTWLDHLNRNLAPALLQSKLANEAEIDFIRRRLTAIEEMKAPEPEKLGAARRILLQAITGMSAGATSRGIVEAIKSSESDVPQ